MPANKQSLCAFCGVPVRVGYERVFWSRAATGVDLFCAACWRLREAGKVMPDGSVQMLLFERERKAG